MRATIALHLLEEEVLAQFEVRQLPDERHATFLRGLPRERVIGGHIYDAHVAEIARVCNACAVVITDNRRHFSSLAQHGVQVLSAEEFSRSTQLDRHRGGSR